MRRIDFEIRGQTPWNKEHDFSRLTFPGAALSQGGSGKGQDTLGRNEFESEDGTMTYTMGQKQGVRDRLDAAVFRADEIKANLKRANIKGDSIVTGLLREELVKMAKIVDDCRKEIKIWVRESGHRKPGEKFGFWV